VGDGVGLRVALGLAVADALGVCVGVLVAVGEGLVVGVRLGVGVWLGVGEAVAVGVRVVAAAAAVPAPDVVAMAAAVVATGVLVPSWEASLGRSAKNHKTVNTPSTKAARATNSQGTGACLISCPVEARIGFLGELSPASGAWKRGHSGHFSPRQLSPW
jgi:hypothetical protein